MATTPSPAWSVKYSVVRLNGGDEEKLLNNLNENILKPLDEQYTDYDVQYEKEKHHLLTSLRGNDFMIVNFEVPMNYVKMMAMTLTMDVSGAFIYAVSSHLADFDFTAGRLFVP